MVLNEKFRRRTRKIKKKDPKNIKAKSKINRISLEYILSQTKTYFFLKKLVIVFFLEKSNEHFSYYP